MKKIFLSILLTSTVSFAKTTLRIPVQTEEGITAAALNVKLKKAGAETLPLYFEVTSDDSGYDLYEAMAKKVAKALDTLNIQSSWRSETIPNSDFTGTCYTGDAKDVTNIVFELGGSFYTEQMNLWGWKYKKQTHINPDEDKAETERFLNAESKLWKNWRGKGEAVLIVLAFSDDGDDVNESIIPKCAK
jgi:hypothetical protein